MAIAISGILLALFTVNVVMGAVANNAILGNVGEMLLLLVASIVFVYEILRREAAEKARKQD